MLVLYKVTSSPSHQNITCSLHDIAKKVANLALNSNTSLILNVAISIVVVIIYSYIHVYLRNKSWKSECVLSFNMG